MSNDTVRKYPIEKKIWWAQEFMQQMHIVLNVFFLCWKSLKTDSHPTESSVHVFPNIAGERLVKIIHDFF